MAKYNRKMNLKLLEICKQATEEKLYADVGAFLGSIVKTFNHILLGDLIWLSRLTDHRTNVKSIQTYSDFRIESLEDQVCSDFSQFLAKRLEVDDDIESLSAEVSDENLQTNLAFTSSSGNKFEKPFRIYVTHFFNHETHDRGQITTLLSQKGLDPGVNDLPYIVSQ